MKNLTVIFVLINSLFCIKKDRIPEFQDIKCIEYVSYAEYAYGRNNYFFVRYDEKNQPIRCLKGN